MPQQPKDKSPAPEIKVLGKKVDKAPAKPADKTREIGGQQGPEPTRYGDWEKGGRCTDF